MNSIVLLQIFVFAGIFPIYYAHEQSFRFKSMKCITKNASIVEVRYCRVKVSRNSSTLSINITAHQRIGKPLTLTVKHIFSYKYGLIYRDIVRVPEFKI